MDIISLARGEKTNHNVSLKTPIKNLHIGLSAPLKKALENSLKDIKAALFIENLKIEEIANYFEIYLIELNLEEE